MKRTLAAVAAAAALALTGCTSSAEDQYLHRLHAEGFTEADSVLLAQGHQVCTRLDGGATVTELVWQAGVESAVVDTDAGKAGTLMGVAIRELCPEHIPAGFEPTGDAS